MKNVIIKIQGGLGNQLFQYATAKSICLSNSGASLFLDINHYRNQNPDETHRNFALQMFDVEYNLVNSLEVKSYLRFNTFKKYFFFLPFVKKYYFEYKNSFDSSLIKIVPPIYLVGNFHSVYYFNRYKKEVRNSLNFKIECLSEKTFLLEKKIENLSNPVSIHFRRTDFVKDKYGKLMGGELPLSYYDAAILMMQKINPEFNLVVFSDDIKWVKKNTNFSISTLYIENASDGKDDSGLADLYLMSKCNHHIIANSTFSWWGAFLNRNENKIVVSPKWWTIEKYWTPNYEPIILKNI